MLLLIRVFSLVDRRRRRRPPSSRSYDSTFVMFLPTIQVALAKVTGDTGLINRKDFFNVMNVYKNLSITRSEEILRIQILEDMMYLFGSRYDGKADFVELSSAIIEICGGTPNSKASLSFSLFDYDGRGHISIHDVELWLHSIFLLVFYAEPTMCEGLHMKSFVARVSEEGFKDFLEMRWKLSENIFISWYGLGVVRKVLDACDAAQENARRKTGTGRIRLDALFFARQGATMRRGRERIRRPRSFDSRRRSRSRSRDRMRSSSDDFDGLQRELLAALPRNDDDERSRDDRHTPPPPPRIAPEKSSHAVDSLRSHLEAMRLNTAAGSFTATGSSVKDPGRFSWPSATRPSAETRESDVFLDLSDI